MLSLQSLVPFIILALLAAQQHQVRADEIEEPGQGTLSTSGQNVGPPEPQDKPTFGKSGSSDTAGPPEPQAQPTFVGGRTVANTSQGPPEPQAQPSFTAGSSSQLSQGPPEPQTRPILSGPPEPSSQPQFSPQPTREVRPLTRPAPSPDSSRLRSGPTEPSTRPHFSSAASDRSRDVRPMPIGLPGLPEPESRHRIVTSWGRPRNVSSYPIEPSRTGYTSYYTSGDRSLPQIEADPVEPGLTVMSRPGTDIRYHHLDEHPPLKTDRFDRPFSQLMWRCDLGVNGCFLRNKRNFVPFQTVPSFANTARPLLVDVADAARTWARLGTRRPNPVVAYNAARLESTEYFPAKYVDACIAFSYYWSGTRGRKYLHILQRNQEDVCIYSAMLDPRDPDFGSKAGRWHDIQLQIDLRYGDAKFWVEWQFDIGERDQQLQSGQVDYYQNFQEFGYVAMRNFSIGYGTCQQNSAWECDIPSSR